MQSLWMLLASAMFAIMGACIKTAADYGASLPQIVLFRGMPSVLLLYAWATYTQRRIPPKSWKLHIRRNLSGITAMWLGFYALSHLPLSTAISLNYTSPLFIAVGLILWGGAGRDPLRVLAVAVGFLGVVGVLRPSIEHEHFFAAMFGLAGGAMGAVAMMQVRELGRVGEAEWRTVLIFSGFVCLSSLGGLAFEGWHELKGPGWLALVGLGVSGMVGQLAMTRAFGLGSALLTAALQYSTIIFAALLGIVFWGDHPDAVAWTGMAFIIASGLLSTWRTFAAGRAKT
ncbi:S-adenosylmethionine uptake transporter [Eoetvoesiella caeni]|uniref:S-adenosylmethionine uptake transporter n=2 Tax=Eoetvoesiella caeni TaxID=645616 RepID=A0A366H7P8_9BURK|nr:S-adenosylmethionine uptake transporter [Eoetvoesiella caeni]